MNRSLILAVLMGACMTTGAAWAESGTINVSGALFGQNCRINGQTQLVSVNVPMPRVSTTALATAGATSGLSPFRIALTECTAGTYRLHFEANTNTNLKAGTLMNTAAKDAATNVEVQLLNDKLQPIHVVTQQNSPAVPVGEDGAGNLDYFARYIATGKATPGAFTSTVGFTLALN